MTTAVRAANCHGCKKPFTDAHSPVTQFSAYGEDCEPKAPDWHRALVGRKQSQCNGCHEVFTTPRTFDSHQTLRDGKVTCKDPRRMFRASDHVRMLVLTTRGWAKNPSLEQYDTFNRQER